MAHAPTMMIRLRVSSGDVLAWAPGVRSGPFAAIDPAVYGG